MEQTEQCKLYKILNNLHFMLMHINNNNFNISLAEISEIFRRFSSIQKRPMGFLCLYPAGLYN